LDEIAPHLRRSMLNLAMKAIEMAGWSPTEPNMLTARCIELIRYVGGEKASNVGLHGDGGSIVVVAVMLSPQSAYTGGAVELVSGEARERYELRAGDALAWRGWTDHRVQEVWSGLREVLVVEWWVGQDCASSHEPRAGDTADSLRYALSLAPASPNLHRWFGEAYCVRLPCVGYRDDEDDAELAETAFRQAVSLAPNSANSLFALGTFLSGSDEEEPRKEALDLLRRAHDLQPSVYTEPQGAWASYTMESLERQDNLRNVMHLLAGAVLVACLFGCIQLMERAEASLASKNEAAKDIKKEESNAKRQEKKKTK